MTCTPDIEFLKMAMARQRGLIESTIDACEYSGVVDRLMAEERKLKRQGAWLVILLVKRGWPGDVELARDIGGGIWP